MKDFWFRLFIVVTAIIMLLSMTELGKKLDAIAAASQCDGEEGE
jgi:hypothetical protein